jgi:hypothetical protein
MRGRPPGAAVAVRPQAPDRAVVIVVAREPHRIVVVGRLELDERDEVDVDVDVPSDDGSFDPPPPPLRHLIERRH